MVKFANSNIRKGHHNIHLQNFYGKKSHASLSKLVCHLGINVSLGKLIYVVIMMCRFHGMADYTVKDRSKHNKVDNSLRLLFSAATSFVRSSGLLRLYWLQCSTAQPFITLFLL